MHEIEINDKAFLFDTSRQNLYEQKDTETINILVGKNRMGKQLRNSHEIVQTPLTKYFPTILNFVNYFVSEYGGECGRIATVKLPSSKSVVPHIDVGEYYRVRDRFHLVIQGMYEYRVEGEANVFSSGDLFWFDSQKTHEAISLGNIDRIAVIFDVKNSNFRGKMNV